MAMMDSAMARSTSRSIPSTNVRSIFSVCSGSSLQIGKCTVPGAEIVDGDPHAHAPHMLQHAHYGGSVGNQHGLRNFEFEQRRLDAALAQNAAERLNEVGVFE